MRLVNDLREVAAAGLGAGFALAADVAMVRAIPERRNTIAALGLVAAAAIYPLSRRRLGIDTEELVTLVAAGAVAAIAARLPEPAARRVLGLGWAAHALYDAMVTHDAAMTRLPATYAPLCAGFDVAMGARLVLTQGEPGRVR